MLDVRAVFREDRVKDVAEFAGDRAETGAVMFAFGAFALVESAEVWIKSVFQV